MAWKGIWLGSQSLLGCFRQAQGSGEPFRVGDISMLYSESLLCIWQGFGIDAQVINDICVKSKVREHS